ncbi:hypothetical protein CLV47_101488 [Antricoccus suffuscus]|uniref:Hemagglutinin n=1 Tax=Antricoccus suffuscus TaxID=1629062 RepID=A0A2T1A6X4_9ACTN|nr:hypothetical protein [Antricoccus suffuscus]PRZ44362.1 hypothetical protein CLV47_101488 [Antricoccus suffuscus]
MAGMTQATATTARRAVLVAIVIALMGAFFTSTAQEARAVSAGDWKAGMIISDAKFFDGNAMSANDVQGFLNSQGANCVAGEMPCLKNYSMPTPPIPAEPGLCSAVGATGGLSAAQIIDVVARACGISQKVILVTLQKESALITKTRPSAINYRSATGFGCPDTAPCDAQYYGFFNQVYRMARQFKVYTNNPTRYGYQKGRNNNIQYNPNAGCGSSNVYIENQATANLYIYTPYQPNTAALNNMYGTGDSCSAYGNRNFWRMYTDWFGSTTDQNAINPQGDLQSVTVSGASILTLTGWAVDMNIPLASVSVAISVNGKEFGSALATVPRPELASYGIPGNHGFSVQLQAPFDGPNEVCATAKDIGGGQDTSLGCKSVTVAYPKINPQGALQSSSHDSNGNITVGGWAVDMSTPVDPVTLMITVNGQAVAFLYANQPKPELAYYGIPGDHGFSVTVKGVVNGPNTVCAYAFNTLGGSDILTGCATESVQLPGSPQGSLDSLTADNAGNVAVKGWVWDVSSPTAPVTVMLTVDGNVSAYFYASDPKPELAHYGIPGDHGANYTLRPGTQGATQVCMYAFNIGAGGDILVGCKSVWVVPPGSPIGSVQSITTGSAGSITVQGWAWDSDVPINPVALMITTDGIPTAFLYADQSLPNLTAYGIPGRHGFAYTFAPKKLGANQVCVYAVNQGAGADVLLGCKTTS